MNCFFQRYSLIAIAVAAHVSTLQLSAAEERKAGKKPSGSSAAILAGESGHRSHIKPFFETYCIKCHGPEKSKGKITLHTLDGDLSKGEELEKWESILEMMESGEMPPIEEPQPTKAEAQAVTKWIESGMRDHVLKANTVKREAKTRRLTNVEYENTLSELLGFELKVIDDLSEDPVDYYHFNNTAALMRIGPEQLDSYLEVARNAMRSAIVDPEKPKTIKARAEWGPGKDEITPLYNKFSGMPERGLGFVSPPIQGEYRIRMSASAVLPPGLDEVPLRVYMRTPIDGDHSEKPYRTIDIAYLTNSREEPKIFEYRGRIENIPFTLGLDKKDGSVVHRRELATDVIFDDGTTNNATGNAPDQERLSSIRAVVNWIEIEAPVFDVWPPKHHADILFESPLRQTDELAYVRSVLERFMSRAYRRPAAANEVERFVQLYRLNRPTVNTFEEAIRETLALMLVAPRFLYHTESDPATDEHYGMASRLSYFLWASMPDQELFDLAAKKKLNDPQVIEQQVTRMLADVKSHRFVENFTMQWLSIKKALTVPINKDLFPQFLNARPIGELAGTEIPFRPKVRNYMMQETVGFVNEMIRQNKSVLNVVDSDFAYLNERLAGHYGIPDIKGMQMRLVPLKPEYNLGGLLTHGSVLIGNGTGTAPHPIYRAVWLREAILGDTVAPPPAEVPALSDSAGASLEGALSIAQLLEKHRTVESCKDCHFRLDPWGLPFEEYNAIGQFQPKVPKDGTRVSPFNSSYKDRESYQRYIESINTIQVSAKSRVPHGPEVNGIRELKAYLLKEHTDEVAENIIRRLMTYGMGRHLTYHDRFAVEEIYKQAENKGFGIRDVIVSICKSSTFRDLPNTKPKK